MTHRLFLAALFVLSACKEDVAQLPDAQDITAESAGFYCQMALLEHVGPKGQIHLDGMPAPLFFSQVRDALAYLHMPEQSHAVVVTYVQDMTGASWDAPGPWIQAQQAHYVIGSDMMGGMDAPEMVPFATRAAALDFVADHGGVIKDFAAIKSADVLTANEPARIADAGQSDIADRLHALTHKMEH